MSSGGSTSVIEPSVGDQPTFFIFLVPVGLSALGDVLVLAFLLYAHRVRRESTEPLHIRLFAQLTLLNLVAMAAWTFGTAPQSFPPLICAVMTSFTYGGIGGDFGAALSICLVMSETLVFHKKIPPWRQSQYLLFPLSSAVVTASLTIGIGGLRPGDKYCTIVDDTEPRAMVITLMAVTVSVLCLLLVTAMTVVLNVRIRNNYHAGIDNEKVQAIVGKLSIRMATYPFITAFVGGSGAVTTLMTSDPDFTRWGRFAAGFGGFLNAVAFFSLDPAFQLMAGKIVLELKAKCNSGSRTSNAAASALSVAGKGKEQFPGHSAAVTTPSSGPKLIDGPENVAREPDRPAVLASAVLQPTQPE